MHWYTCKSLLNTLGIAVEHLAVEHLAVEQLAGCLAKQSKSQQSRSKYNSHATPARRVKIFNKMT